MKETTEVTQTNLKIDNNSYFLSNCAWHTERSWLVWFRGLFNKRSLVISFLRWLCARLFTHSCWFAREACQLILRNGVTLSDIQKDGKGFNVSNALSQTILSIRNEHWLQTYFLLQLSKGKMNRPNNMPHHASDQTHGWYPTNNYMMTHDMFNRVNVPTQSTTVTTLQHPETHHNPLLPKQQSTDPLLMLVEMSPHIAATVVATSCHQWHANWILQLLRGQQLPMISEVVRVVTPDSWLRPDT